MASSALTSEPVARVLSCVPDAKRDGIGWRARCPAHGGKSATSLSIAQGEDGRVLLKCHAGCSHRAILDALGLDERAMFPATDRAAAPPLPRHTLREFATARAAADAYRATLGREDARWDYHDASGEPIGIVLRWDREDGSKTIRPAWRIGQGWRHTYPEVRPLYALDRLAESPEARVFVVEGEKCAAMLSTLGLLATTSPAGANSAGKADWSPLAGREVAIVPDADDAGRRYAADASERLKSLDPPARVAIMKLPGLGPCEDVVEFVERVHGGDRHAARKAIEDLAATAFVAAPRKRITLGELLDDPRTLSKPETIECGWEPWDRVQPFEAVERGTIHVLAAPPGCYKTATMLRMARGYAECGRCVEWLAAEMPPRTLFRRIVCQAARLGQGALASDAMPEEHRRAIEDTRRRMEPIRDRIAFTVAPIGFVELERAADSADVVFLDYLQLVRHSDPGVRGHERIEEAMAKIAECAQRTGAVFIVASSQGRDGGDGRRNIHNATKGSSSIEYSADALYCAEEPKPGPHGITVKFDCLKQREGERFELEVPIDDRTKLVAEEVGP